MKPIFFAKITKDGKIDFYNLAAVNNWLYKNRGKEITVPLELETKRRTKRQNSALHVYFQLLADELNNAGLDMKKVLKPEVDIEWTLESVKEYLWRPIQMAQLGKKSTTRLKTDEIDKVYNTLNRFLGEKLQLPHVPFPSIENPIYD